jgi:ATP-dependent Clp endopeptidase proteolytic subunit ClpP
MKKVDELSEAEISAIVGSNISDADVRQHAAAAENLLFNHGIDINQGTIELIGGIEEESFVALLRGMKLLDSMGHDSITILLNSGGGEIYAGLAIYDLIMGYRSKGTPVNVIGFGTVMSAAAFILQAATTRILSPSCYLLLHYGSSADEGEALTTLRASKHYKALLTKMEDIFVSRSGKKRLTVSKWLDRDTYFSAEDAVAAGLADIILK